MYRWAQNEIQTLFLGGATGGTFTMGDGTTDTPALDYDASDATIETALEVIYGVGNVTVVVGVITFVLSVGASSLEANFTSLTGATDPTLTETQEYTLQELKILWGSYRPPHSPSLIAEINAIPSPTISNSVTILQDGGRERLSVSIQSYVSTMAEYDGLLDDHHAANVKTFYGPESLEFESIIRNISPPEYVQAGHIKFSITFMEEES